MSNNGKDKDSHSNIVNSNNNNNNDNGVIQTQSSTSTSSSSPPYKNNILLDSPEYQQFLNDNFNVVSYTSNVLKISSISTSLEKLSIGKQEITQELNNNITNNYQYLFNQASNIREFENETEQLKVGLKSLEESIMRMKKEISEPYKNIKGQINQLKRVQDTCELLRVVIRYLSLIKKLKIHLKDGRDMAKAAQSIHEIDTIRKENNLSGITIVDQQVEWLNRCREQVVTTAGNLLLQGMDTQNQSEVANSLQVFYNLGILVDRVNSVVNATTERVTKSIKAMLNVNKLVSSGNSTSSSSSTQHSHSNKNNGHSPNTTTTTTTTNTNNNNNTDQNIWSKIESVTSTLYTSCIQIWQLQRVLSKIRDPITNKTLMDVIQQAATTNNTTNTTTTTTQNTSTTTTTSSYNISLSFWRTVTKSLETNLSVAAKSSSIIENTFIIEYPKISRYFQDFSKRLMNYCDLQQGVVVGISLEDHQLLFKSIAMFERGYLERTRDRMLAILNSMFPQSTWGRDRCTRCPRQFRRQPSDIGREQADRQSGRQFLTVQLDDTAVQFHSVVGLLTHLCGGGFQSDRTIAPTAKQYLCQHSRAACQHFSAWCRADHQYHASGGVVERQCHFSEQTMLQFHGESSILYQPFPELLPLEIHSLSDTLTANT
ncbi:oligomeric Golgi complex component [Heterostelium album PN500]|uniref:Conserved oligomeric Golgi complex subunit 5 n=1 Tax=Heterostelium pallidum (strain ATCC 26659 / Pp 5 / PN500) TaxID=670386 RepID=D3B814_HETP5|nr:oligomeric Golgi complex component [Heterostelium album PN500]EFA82182.1 oligomeric Golgi complex component [Heterostelium album PN500]|eukprot:XP_020434299.1 oligomeric Golgi complex component [Heterostelium album PN500]